MKKTYPKYLICSSLRPLLSPKMINWKSIAVFIFKFEILWKVRKMLSESLIIARVLIFVTCGYNISRQSCTFMLTILSFSEKCKNKGLTVRPLFLHVSVKQKKNYSKYFLSYSLRPYMSPNIYLLKNNWSNQLQNWYALTWYTTLYKVYFPYFQKLIKEWE